jgi:hypothetical protein
MQKFLTSALDGGEWSVSRPGGFTVGERATGAQWIGGWVGFKSRSGRGGEEKNSLPLTAKLHFEIPCQILLRFPDP